MTLESDLLAAADERPRFDPWALRLRRETCGLTCRTLATRCKMGAYGFQQVSSAECYRRSLGQRAVERLEDELGLARGGLQSTGAEWREGKARFRAWCAAGRPDLVEWVEQWLAAHVSPGKQEGV